MSNFAQGPSLLSSAESAASAQLPDPGRLPGSVASAVAALPPQTIKCGLFILLRLPLHPNTVSRVVVLA